MKKDAGQSVKIQFVSDSAILVEFVEGSLKDKNRRVLNLYFCLQNLLSIDAVTNLHPAFASLMIDFDPRHCDPHQLIEEIQVMARSEISSDTLNGELVTVPTLYGGEEGPDLAEVSKLTRLSPDEIIELHSSAEYQVAFLGFAPGFPYLLGLPSKLYCPRKSSPRLRVPHGSVAIAGVQAGIYPSESPGGWRLIGRTPSELFSADREPPTLLKPGDRVRFRPVTMNDSPAESKERPQAIKARPIEPAALEVIQPGFFSTIQDLGRAHLAHLGISFGGAADPLALRLGNRIVGNEECASAIEMTAEGGGFLILKDTWLAVTGADCSPELDQQKIAMWTSVPVSAGQVLRTQTMSTGLRSYLCLHGGIGVEAVLGSRSTFVAGNWGGFEGRRLQTGDRLPSGRQIQGTPGYRRIDPGIEVLYRQADGILRITKGPQWDWFSHGEREKLLTSEYEVSPDLNRLGIRLTGNAIGLDSQFESQELLSEGVANGAVQIPTSGQPLLLFCEQQTTGGYAKIGNVIRADWFRLGQLKPGQVVRFNLVEFDDTFNLQRELESTIQSVIHDF